MDQVACHIHQPQNLINVQIPLGQDAVLLVHLWVEADQIVNSIDLASNQLIIIQLA